MELLRLRSAFMQWKEQVGSFRISMAVVDIIGAGSRPILASKLSTKVAASTLTVREGRYKILHCLSSQRDRLSFR